MLKVAFQGEHGAYSEAALLAYYVEAVDPMPYPLLDHVFEHLDAGDCDQAIVPVENSLGGTIHRTYDLFQRYTLHIIGEKIFRVRHCLIAHPDATLGDIRKIISHPQALAQCEGYIDKLGVEREPWYDTAGAVKWLAEGGDRDHAAIASRHAAEYHGMQVLAEGIEDVEANYTRFLVLAREPSIPTDQDAKTSVVFTLPQGGTTPGSLFRALGVFALRDINLTKIESRPLRSQTFQYIFYLEFEGSQSEQNCERALEHLREISPDVRVLGSYPRDAGW